ncbi:MAG: hypothetical protein JWQ90_3031 [Hydrocarboniphaga sp.]|uniref:hypothetical protein n=1 Tax=Hydrocarboniphaga sp. TaxID=2033016 RepID=UPI00261FA40A|nr:hypothetical protein [Hydrocarboniphaga sp.]MDB5970581.1 hypothetical protein [Hydrocarboniphaga sp.]
MNPVLAKNGPTLLLLTGLAGCASYGQTDLASAGYEKLRQGAYVSVGPIVQMRSKTVQKPSYRDEPGRLAIRADEALLAELNCGEKSNGIGYSLATKYYQITVSKDAHISYAPLIESASGEKTCKVLINIVDANGRYLKHDFDTVVNLTSDGEKVYSYKLVTSGADAPKVPVTEAAPPPR